jgi:hypothetical protein
MNPSCDRCRRTTDRLVTTYWGPSLCPECCTEIATILDEHDRWPELPTDLIPDTPTLT